MNKPAIVTIAYNRPDALKRLLDSLALADYPEDKDIPLIVSIDYSGSDECKKVADAFEWKYGEKRVVAHEENLKLKKHVLSCGDYADEFGSIIVLEDDIYVSPSFYEYAVKALDFSEGKIEIAGISLYNHLMNVHAREPFEAIDDGYDNWYFQFASSWGQAYTKKQWAAFKTWMAANDGSEIAAENVPENVSGWSKQSWLKYFIKYVIVADKYFLYPRISYTTNFSDVGTHAQKNDTDVQVPLAGKSRAGRYNFSAVDESESVYDAFFENAALRERVAEYVAAECGKSKSPTEDILSKDVEIDLYGLKSEKLFEKNQTKLLVSSKPYAYKVLASFGRQLRPIDANICTEIDGNAFFIYDLQCAGAVPETEDRAEKYLYNYKAISAAHMIDMIKFRLKEKMTGKR